MWWTGGAQEIHACASVPRWAGKKQVPQRGAGPACWCFCCWCCAAAARRAKRKPESGRMDELALLPSHDKALHANPCPLCPTPAPLPPAAAPASADPCARLHTARDRGGPAGCEPSFCPSSLPFDFLRADSPVPLPSIDQRPAGRERSENQNIRTSEHRILIMRRLLNGTRSPSPAQPTRPGQPPVAVAGRSQTRGLARAGCRVRWQSSCGLRSRAVCRQSEALVGPRPAFQAEPDPPRPDARDVGSPPPSQRFS